MKWLIGNIDFDGFWSDIFDLELASAWSCLSISVIHLFSTRNSSWEKFFWSKDHRQTSINIPKVNCDSGQKDESTMEKFLWSNLEHMHGLQREATLHVFC